MHPYSGKQTRQLYRVVLTLWPRFDQTIDSPRSLLNSSSFRDFSEINSEKFPSFIPRKFPRKFPASFREISQGRIASPFRQIHHQFDSDSFFRLYIALHPIRHFFLRAIGRSAYFHSDQFPRRVVALQGYSDKFPGFIPAKLQPAVGKLALGFAIVQRQAHSTIFSIPLI